MKLKDRFVPADDYLSHVATKIQEKFVSRREEQRLLMREYRELFKAKAKKAMEKAGRKRRA